MERRLRELAQALCDKLYKVHSSEKYKGIWVYAKNHGLTYDGPVYSGELAALNDYLHGQGEKGEEMPRPNEWPTINIRHKQFKVRMVDDDQPSPTPTREEWVEWVKAFVWTVIVHPTNEKRLTEVLLTMPIVPKAPPPSEAVR